VENGLSLFRAAVEIAFFAVFAELGDVALYGLPTFDLAAVIGTASSHIVSAVPLKPAPRVFVVNPALVDPERQWL
jgi:hypothetical protein